MASRLHTRLDSLEQQAAPLIERRRERMREIAKLRAYIQPDLDEVMEFGAYCEFPNLIDLRAQIESD